MIVENAVRCTRCDDFIFSKHRHDFVTCNCGSISVDGGQSYLRRSGDLESAIDYSWSIEDDIYEACAIAVEDAIDTNRNKYGIANAVLRQLRSSERITGEGEPRILAKGQGVFEDEIMITEPDGTVNRYRKVI